MKWLFLALALTVTACSNKPCRELRNPELAANQIPAARPTSAATPTGASANTGTQTGATAVKEGTLLVYKADGSLQCQAAKGMSVDEMEKQLAGIKVYSRDKRPDGLMHIQVCGSPTGMINVYEIDAKDLSKAEAKGFQRFDPR